MATCSKSAMSVRCSEYTSSCGMCTASRAPHRSVERISQRHHARVSGIGSLHGARTRHVWPIFWMAEVNVCFHQSCGKLGAECWLFEKRSIQK